MDDILKKLIEIIADKLSCDVGLIEPENDLVEELNMAVDNPVTHAILFDIEMEFDIDEPSVEEWKSIITVEDAARYIHKKTKESADC